MNSQRNAEGKEPQIKSAILLNLSTKQKLKVAARAAPERMKANGVAGSVLVDATTTVVVLPFVNTTVLPGVDQLSNDFTDLIVEEISKLGVFGAVARGRMPSLGCGNSHFAGICQRLRADLLLIGEIRRSCGVSFATAQLVKSSTGQPVLLLRCATKAPLRAETRRRVAVRLASQLSSI